MIKSTVFLLLLYIGLCSRFDPCDMDNLAQRRECDGVPFIEMVESPAYLDGVENNTFRALIQNFDELQHVFWGLSGKYHNETERMLFDRQIKTYNEGIHQGFTISPTLPNGEYHVVCTAIDIRGKVSFKNGIMKKVPEGFVVPKKADPELAQLNELLKNELEDFFKQ